MQLYLSLRHFESVTLEMKDMVLTLKDDLNPGEKNIKGIVFARELGFSVKLHYNNNFFSKHSPQFAVFMYLFIFERKKENKPKAG